jgi:hypothetical protein
MLSLADAALIQALALPRMRDLPDGLVLALALIGDLPQQVVFGPRQVGDLHDHSA